MRIDAINPRVILFAAALSAAAPLAAQIGGGIPRAPAAGSTDFTPATAPAEFPFGGEVIGACVFHDKANPSGTVYFATFRAPTGYHRQARRQWLTFVMAREGQAAAYDDDCQAFADRASALAWARSAEGPGPHTEEAGFEPDWSAIHPPYFRWRMARQQAEEAERQAAADAARAAAEERARAAAAAAEAAQAGEGGAAAPATEATAEAPATVAQPVVRPAPPAVAVAETPTPVARPVAAAVAPAPVPASGKPVQVQLPASAAPAAPPIQPAAGVSTPEEERARLNREAASFAASQVAANQASLDKAQADQTAYEKALAKTEAQRQQYQQALAQNRKDVEEADRRQRIYQAELRRHDACVSGDKQACADIEAGRPVDIDSAPAN
jgi:hypothetical protein